MKNIILGLMLLLAQSSFGQNVPARIQLQNTSIANLQINRSDLSVTVAYPTEDMTGVCALDIVADAEGKQIPIEKLLDAVEIMSLLNKDTPVGRIISKTVIRVQLDSLYVDGILLRTKSGRSLREEIAKTLGENRKLVIMPRSCK